MIHPDFIRDREWEIHTVTAGAMADFQARLDGLVDDFLSGWTSLSEFQRLYSACYADEEADRNFNANDVEYYGGILERAEWTSPRPSSEEQQLGWQDEAGLKAWLRTVSRSSGR